MGPSFNGRTVALHAANRGSIPRGSTLVLEIQSKSLTDCSSVWQSAAFGTQMSGVQIPPIRRGESLLIDK